MNITLVSPYHGGSHQAWAEGFKRYSIHEVNLLTLPDRYWKWRMHGGAVTLARMFLERNHSPDIILATGMLDLTSFLALTRHRTGQTPAALYMHENQLTYPLPKDPAQGPMRRQRGERDHHYSFINYASMLSADQIFFNSEFHRAGLFTALRGFLKRFPEYNELESIERLKRKSSVLPVGIDFKRFHPQPSNDQLVEQKAPLIIWNQRWEYDKNPEDFFQALYKMIDFGLDFRVAICGQNFRRQPTEFSEARERLGSRLIHAGHASEELYRSLLWESLLTVSTAHHEFFGISILEAAHCQTLPILPKRLSYPELIPPEFHADCLYDNQTQLVHRLERALENPVETAKTAKMLSPFTQRFCWSHLAPEYERQLWALHDPERGGNLECQENHA